VGFESGGSNVNLYRVCGDVVPLPTTRAEDSVMVEMASNMTSEITVGSAICFQELLDRSIRIRRAVPVVTAAAITCLSDSGAYVWLFCFSKQ